MNKHFLITLLHSEDTEYYLYVWSQEIIDLAEEKGFKVFQLEKGNACRDKFEGHLQSINPCFVMLNGHGNNTTICGNRLEPILKEGENHALLAGRVVYARSCYALSSLGRASAKDGCNAFIGYSAPFSFVSHPGYISRPLKDPLAYPCLQTSNLIPISLLKGSDIDGSVKKAKEKMAELMVEWETRVEKEATFVASCIYWNISFAEEHPALKGWVCCSFGEVSPSRSAFTPPTEVGGFSADLAMTCLGYEGDGNAKIV
ncbi:MAG: hypothetical protein V1728_05885 [Candidatus Micrarchaeota archaeon]